MDEAKARGTAKVGLPILVLASAWPDQDVPISFAQALDIVDWADTDPARYRDALGGNWTPFIESAFDRLTDQEMVNGVLDKPAKKLVVGAAPTLQAKLNEVMERAERGVTSSQPLWRRRGVALPMRPAPSWTSHGISVSSRRGEPDTLRADAAPLTAQPRASNHRA